MCSCFRNISCCWDAPVSRKQEEVADNERNQPYIISPPGYINAAFEDGVTSIQVVSQQPQRCDITIEAPPRQQNTLLESALLQHVAIPASLQSADLENVEVTEHLETCQAGPSNLPSHDDSDASVQKTVRQKQFEIFESNNEEVDANCAQPLNKENDQQIEMSSTIDGTEVQQNPETSFSDLDTHRNICDEEIRTQFHWLPICSLESQVSDVESESVQDEEEQSLFQGHPVCRVTESQVSEVGSISSDQMESEIIKTLTELHDSDPGSSSISKTLEDTRASSKCQDLPIPGVPNTSNAYEANESTNFFISSQVEKMQNELTTQMFPHSVSCPDAVSSCDESPSLEEPEESNKLVRSSFISLITVNHDEDSVNYHTLSPTTGLSMDSLDSAISMGSSPRYPDESFRLSRSNSCNLGCSSEELSHSYNDLVEQFDCTDQRSRFVSLTSVRTSSSDLNNEEFSVTSAEQVMDLSEDQSDGEVDVSDGEISISKELNVTTLKLSDTETTTTNSVDSSPTSDESKNENYFNVLSSFDNQECYEEDSWITAIPPVNYACNPCSDTGEALLLEENYENELHDDTQGHSLTDMEENPAELILDLSNLFIEKELLIEVCGNTSADSPSTNEILISNATHYSPVHLKELAIEKLVDIIYVASYASSENFSDGKQIMASVKEKIMNMLFLKLHQFQPNSDLPNVINKIVDGKLQETDYACTLMDKALVDKLRNALQSGDKIEIKTNLQMLLKLGYANEIYHPQGEDGSLISIASQHGPVSFFEILKDNGIEFNLKDKLGFYPIHYAIIEGNFDLVDFFAKEGHLGMLTSEKDSALHLAVNEGDLQLSRQLIEIAKQSSTCLELVNRDGMTPLHLAVVAGHVGIVRCLIYHGFNVNTTTCQGQSAVMLAAHKEHFEIAEILLSNGASPLTEDIKGNNILHHFVSCRSYILLDVTLTHYYPKDAIDKQNVDGHSALHTAALNGDEIAVLSLLNNGANINLPDLDGRTSLLLCAARCRAGLITTLVTLGADVHHQDNQGNTVLHYIAETGNGAIVDFLLHQCQVSPDVQNNLGQTALHVAAKCSHGDVIAVLLTSSIKLDVPDLSGRMPLHEACRQGNLTVVAQLVYSGAKVDSRDENDMTPVVIAGLRRAVDVVQYLISKDNDSESLYDLAKFAPADDIIFLKNYNVDFDKQDHNGNTALHHAILHCNEQVAKLLLEAGVTASLLNNQSNSVLHLACASSSVEMVDLLIKSSCLIDCHNKRGETPAYIAAVEKRHHILSLLIKHGANLNTKLRDGRTLIFVAAENDDAELTQVLLSHGADANYVCSGNMTTPIHVAAKLGHKAVMAVLLKVVTEVDITEFFSRKTPLHFAAEGGWTEVVLQLLDVGADVNLETGCGEKALHLAAREGHSNVVETLLQAGTQLSLLDEDGCPRYDLSQHRHVWAVIKTWALQHPSSVSSQRRLPAALVSLRNVIREAFRSNRSHQNVLDATSLYT